MHSDHEIHTRLAPHTDQACLVALDAPLVVHNPTGRRGCCAYVVLFSVHRLALTTVYGDVDSGYIVTPTQT